MQKDDPNDLIAAELAVEGSFHPDGVNTPDFITGRALRFWNAKLRFKRMVLILCGTLLTLLIFVQVVTRYLLGISLFGIEELASFIAVYLYFIGATHGTWERGHISASLTELILPAGRPQLLVAAIAALITTILCAWMTVWAWQYLAFVIRRGTQSLETGIPMSFIVVIIPLCLSLMTLYFAFETLMRLQSARRGGNVQ